VLTEVHEQEIRSYIPEPERGRRNWQGEGKAEEQKRTYENRRRVRGDRNKRLQGLCLQLFTLGRAFARFERIRDSRTQPKATLWRKVAEFVTLILQAQNYAAALKNDYYRGLLV
jgi:hypothetical protein